MTTVNVIPANRYAVLSRRRIEQKKPMPKTAVPNTAPLRPKYLPSRIAKPQPSAVPTNVLTDVANVAPKVDCKTMRVEMDAQYASGNPSARATYSESTAASAVRAEWPNHWRHCRSRHLSLSSDLVVLNQVPAKRINLRQRDNFSSVSICNRFDQTRPDEIYSGHSLSRSAGDRQMKSLQLIFQVGAVERRSTLGC